MITYSVILLREELKCESVCRWLVLNQLHTRLHNVILSGGCIHQPDTALSLTAKRRSSAILADDQVKNYIFPSHHQRSRKVVAVLFA